jgi:hypothetical protein
MVVARDSFVSHAPNMTWLDRCLIKHVCQSCHSSRHDWVASVHFGQRAAPRWHQATRRCTWITSMYMTWLLLESRQSDQRDSNSTDLKNKFCPSSFFIFLWKNKKKSSWSDTLSPSRSLPFPLIIQSGRPPSVTWKQDTSPSDFWPYLVKYDKNNWGSGSPFLVRTRS